MQPTDKSQFTEEQRRDAFRTEVVHHLVEQTKALDTIRLILVLFTVLFCVGALVAIIVSVNGA